MGVYIRTKDKIEKYIDSLMKKYGNCELSSGLRSRYYTIQNKVLRISDHIGSHSEAYISIVVPSFSTGDNYIIHAHNTGQVSVVDYEKVKEIVRSFFYLSSIFCEVGANREQEISSDDNQDKERKKVNKLLKELENYQELKKAADKRKKTILGVPMDSFTKAQLKQINAFINQISNK